MLLVIKSDEAAMVWIPLHSFTHWCLWGAFTISADSLHFLYCLVT